MSPVRRELARATVALLAGLVVAACLAVVAELSFRFYRTRSLSMDPMFWASDPLLGYRLNPARQESPDGFRGQGPRPRRNGRLVICLGGSTTYGHLMEWRKAWPFLAQEMLRSRGEDADVINAGLPGYGSRQLLLRYEHQLARLSPDIVIVFEGWNRTGILVDSSGWEPFGVRGNGALPRLIRATAVHSMMVRVAMTQAKVRRTTANSAFQPDPHQPVWEADMDALVRTIAEHGQHPMVVIYPSLYHDGMDSAELATYRGKGWQARPFDQRMLDEIRAKHDALRRIARTYHADVLDLEGAIASLRGAERLALFLDEMHLSVAGNQRVAELVAAAIESATGPPPRRATPVPGG